MRFTFIPIALFVLSHSVIPSVHGVPMVASNHANSLAARQDLVSNLTSSLVGLVGSLEKILGLSSQQVQKIAQALQPGSSSAYAVRNALLGADSTSLASTTTTSRVPAASATTSIVGNASSRSLGAPTSLSTPPIRTRRQVPTTLLSLVPTQSLPTSVAASVTSKPGSVTSNAGSATSKTTTSHFSMTSSRG